MPKVKKAATASLFDEPSPTTPSGNSQPPANFPAEWVPVLKDEFAKPYYRELSEFMAAERAAKQVLPPEADVFNSLAFTSPADVRVVILGQDPYPTPGHAHGLCFSVRSGVAIPASLRNIYKELADDVNVSPPKHGNLETWAKQGVLLLNAVLTVRAGEANSHQGKGWEKFTDAVLADVNKLSHHVAFVLWGGYAQKKTALIDATRHTVIASAHPSPLSAKNGFFGSKPFSKVNATLEKHGQKPIEWALPTSPG